MPNSVVGACARKLGPAVAIGILAVVQFSVVGPAFASGEPADSSRADLVPTFHDDAMLKDSFWSLDDLEQSSVDTWTGSVKRKAVDVVLPGPGGLDIVVQRTYRSAPSRVDLGDPLATNRPYRTYSPYGLGWDMGFGMVEDWVNLVDPATQIVTVRQICETDTRSMSTRPILHLPGGEGEETFARSKRDFIDNGPHYVSRSGWGITCKLTPLPDESTFYLTSPAGLKYELELLDVIGGRRQHHVVRVSDPSVTTNNYSISYQRFEDHFGRPHWLPDSVSATDGRYLVFQYSQEACAEGVCGVPDVSNPVLDSISDGYLGAPVVDYEYAYYAGSVLHNKLTAVSLRGGLARWEYDYAPVFDAKAQGSMILAVNPFGGETHYEWETHVFQNDANDRIPAEASVVAYSPVVQRVMQKSPAGVSTGPSRNTVWEYTYEWKRPSCTPGEEWACDLEQRYGTIDVTRVKVPDGTWWDHYHVSAGQVYRGSDGAVGRTWTVGLNVRNIQYAANGTTELRRETSEFWSAILSAPGVVYGRTGSDGAYPSGMIVDSDYTAPVLKKKTTKIDGAEWVVEYSSFTAPGGTNFVAVPQPRRIEYSGPGSRSMTRILSYEDRDAYQRWNLVTSEKILRGTYGDESALPPLKLYAYDDAGRLTRREEYGNHVTYTYHPDTGDLWTQADGRSNTTTFSNYRRGKPQRIDNPDATFSTSVVDDWGRITSTTDEDGITTGYARDGLGRVTSIDYPGQLATLAVNYAEGGNPRSLLKTRGNYQERIGLDYFGREISKEVKATEGEQTIQAIEVIRRYDDMGRLEFVSNPNSTVDGVSLAYDDRGEIETETSSKGIRHYDRDYGGIRSGTLRVIDEHGDWVDRTFENILGPFEGPVVRIAYENNEATAIDYTPYGLVEQITQGLFNPATNAFVGQPVSRTYEYANFRLWVIQEPESADTVFDYDYSGNVEWISQGNREVHQEWDARNRLKTVEHTQEGSTLLRLDYTFTDAGRPKTGKRRDYRYSNGNTSLNQSVWTSFYREVDGLLDHETLDVDYAQPVVDRSLTVSYEYDGLGSITRLQYPSGNIAWYAPDAFGWPRSVHNESNQFFAQNVLYHPTGQISSLSFGNGKTLQMGLDPDHFAPSSIMVPGVVSRSFEYHENGRLKAIVDGMGNDDVSLLEYDDVGRLVVANGRWGNGSFQYDATGNLWHQALGGKETWFDIDPATNRLDQVRTRKSVLDVQHDAYGNRTLHQQQQLAYDALNNLVAAGASSFGYDARGRRVLTASGNDVRLSVYSSGDQLLYEERSGGLERTDYIFLGANKIAKRDFRPACDDDSDGDGIGYCAEVAAGLNPFDGLDNLFDADGDGLNNLQEFQLGTSISKADTDKDGVTDGVEYLAACFDPLLADSDGDGIPDDVEYSYGFDPCLNEAGYDDGDGIGWADEIYVYRTDPRNADSDGDGLNDAAELFSHGTNPLVDGDEDGDGLSDASEILVHNSNPFLVDSDGDGLSDDDEVLHGTRPDLADTDGDGLDDALEIASGGDPLNAEGDRDGDGLSDADEQLVHSTDPDVADTDGDGFWDGWEVAHAVGGYSPLLTDYIGTVVVAPGSNFLRLMWVARPERAELDGGLSLEGMRPGDVSYAWTSNNRPAAGEMTLSGLVDGGTYTYRLRMHVNGMGTAYSKPVSVQLGSPEIRTQPYTLPAGLADDATCLRRSMGAGSNGSVFVACQGAATLVVQMVTGDGEAFAPLEFPLPADRYAAMNWRLSVSPNGQAVLFVPLPAGGFARWDWTHAGGWSEVVLADGAGLQAIEARRLSDDTLTTAQADLANSIVATGGLLNPAIPVTGKPAAELRQTSKRLFWYKVDQASTSFAGRTFNVSQQIWQADNAPISKFGIPSIDASEAVAAFKLKDDADGMYSLWAANMSDTLRTRKIWDAKVTDPGGWAFMPAEGKRYVFYVANLSLRYYKAYQQNGEWRWPDTHQVALDNQPGLADRQHIRFVKNGEVSAALFWNDQDTILFSELPEGSNSWTSPVVFATGGYLVEADVDLAGNYTVLVLRDEAGTANDRIDVIVRRPPEAIPPPACSANGVPPALSVALNGPSRIPFALLWTLVPTVAEPVTIRVAYDDIYPDFIEKDLWIYPANWVQLAEDTANSRGVVEFPQETSLQLGWRMRDWSPYVYGDMPSTDLTVKATDCEGLSSISSHTLYEDYTKLGSFDLFSNFPGL
jgi:YD repeat-containing protein